MTRSQMLRLLHVERRELIARRCAHGWLTPTDANQLDHIEEKIDRLELDEERDGRGGRRDDDVRHG